ncbi:hypothetical protein X975_15917, partial [Stegodyphus mimosarum]
MHVPQVSRDEHGVISSEFKPSNSTKNQMTLINIMKGN